MPWVRRRKTSAVHRLHRVTRRLAYDHSNALTSLGIGAACIIATIVALRVVGLI